MDLTAPIMLCLLLVIAFQFNPSLAAHIKYSDDKSGAIAGRFVSIPGKIYRNTFREPINLGKCPLVMKDGSIKTCKDEFEGERMYFERGATIVDVCKVLSAEDILVHTMGGAGVGVDVLGLVDVNPKVKVAVKTDTNKNALNLITSYVINKGVFTLHNPRPKFIEGDKALFLSEIEIGGNEKILVTLQFESEEKKVEVESSIKFKVFISISDRLKYVEKTFKSKASCRIQFNSSWRKDLDEYFSELSQCIPRLKQMEEMYLKGPQELRDMTPEDERSHYFYYFSSWKSSPYGSQNNLGWMKYDIEFLTKQNMEIKVVLERINKLKDQQLSNAVKKEILQLNSTLTDITQRITNGLKEYRNLKAEERDKLRDIYGRDKAPMYYQRYLEKIITTEKEAAN